MVRHILPTRIKSSTSSPSRSKFFKDAMGPLDDIAPGLMLRVSILQGKDLAAKDKGGTSDPYLVVSVGDSRIITHSVPKSLNPEWNVVEEVPVNSVQSLVLDSICWDKDRFGKDYMGEFDIALEEIFSNENATQPPTWYPLRSKKPGKKTSVVSGEVQLQFTLFDKQNPSASDQQVLEKFQTLVRYVQDRNSRTNSPSQTPPFKSRSASPSSQEGDDTDDAGATDEAKNVDSRRRRLRIKSLKKKRRDHAYEFAHSGSDVVGIIFLEICRITDLPPESNLTRTSFDMDPFVVVSLGKRTYRTRRVRHNLNPVFNEKMVFQVLSHEKAYSFSFTVIDHDKYSGNDFVASCTFPVQDLIRNAPIADPETGLYPLRDPDFVPSTRPKFKRLGMSRSPSAQSLSKMGRPNSLKPTTPTSITPSSSSTLLALAAATATATATASSTAICESPLRNQVTTPKGTEPPSPAPEENMVDEEEDSELHKYIIPLKMKNQDKWEDKHSPVLYLRAKYMPYAALRQQFWRAMLKQYDADESGLISKVELTTMLDTLGSTLREFTINGFFQRFPHKDIDGEVTDDLTMDEAVICLEEQLEKRSKPATFGDKVKVALEKHAKDSLHLSDDTSNDTEGAAEAPIIPADMAATVTLESGTRIEYPPVATPTIVIPEDSFLSVDDNEMLETVGSEEHVVEIRQCPICHQPRLDKRSDSDIITHIATCASQDWRKVNNLMMGGFVTASQAQRKWYSKVITKVSYGGYRLGANSANILVQDRITGQISEEKMSVYVRLGIRLLYKGFKSNNMETKRIRKLLKSMSIKQGRKFEDPASKSQIESFIAFHQLDMSEVLLPIDQFKNFNEFFYRALKPGARPCSAPDNPRIVVSPADCRTVVFNQVDEATRVWIKGREFSVKRLLGDAYPEDVARYEHHGALGIFRLAPQDYHRFHIPVDGRMGKPVTIAGEYYTVNPMAIRSELDVYGENVRVLVPIDSAVFGRVMVICVGAMMVGSTVISRKEGEEVKRAEELGYFKFGGSTLILLFEPGKMVFDDDLVDNSVTALETLVRAGMSVGHAPDEPQWTPDMRKKETDVTEAEKEEAKRRIQGSVLSGESPETSGDDGASNGL